MRIDPYLFEGAAPLNAQPLSDAAQAGHTLLDDARQTATRCLTIAERRRLRLEAEEPPEWCIDLKKWPYDRPSWRDWLKKRRAGLREQHPEAN